MPRIAGDNNLSLREKRKDAQIVALKAEIETQKAKTKVVAARNKELQEKLKEKKDAKTAEKPVSKPAVKPAAKPVEKPVVKPAAKTGKS